MFPPQFTLFDFKLAGQHSPRQCTGHHHTLPDIRRTADNGRKLSPAGVHGTAGQFIGIGVLPGFIHSSHNHLVQIVIKAFNPIHLQPGHGQPVRHLLGIQVNGNIIT